MPEWGGGSYSQRGCNDTPEAHASAVTRGLGYVGNLAPKTSAHPNPVRPEIKTASADVWEPYIGLKTYQYYPPELLVPLCTKAPF